MMIAQKKTRHEDEPIIPLEKLQMDFLSKLRYIYYHRLNNTSRGINIYYNGSINVDMTMV